MGLEAPYLIHDDEGVSRRYFSLGDEDSEMMAAGVLDAQGCVALMSKLKIVHVRHRRIVASYAYLTTRTILRQSYDALALQHSP